MNQEYKPITLYIKTHNITGLKYFGKTNQDPYKYKGSGKYWVCHLKKHGYDVSTEIVGVFTDEIWIKFYALEFSEINNIVTSKEWANLKPENGSDGGWILSNESQSKGLKTQIDNKIGWFAPEVQAKSLKTRISNKSDFFDPEFHIKNQEYLKENKLGFYDPEVQIKAQSKEAKEKRRNTVDRNKSFSGEKSSNFGKIWITDGVSSQMIKKELSIPKGWYKGRIRGHKIK